LAVAVRPAVLDTPQREGSSGYPHPIPNPPSCARQYAEAMPNNVQLHAAQMSARRRNNDRPSLQPEQRYLRRIKDKTGPHKALTSSLVR
jgi:hypothetical protein